MTINKLVCLWQALQTSKDTKKKRYTKKKLLAQHKAIRLIIVLRRMGIGGCFKGRKVHPTNRKVRSRSVVSRFLMHFASTLRVKVEANLQRTYSEASLDPPWQGIHLLSYTQKAQKQGATFEKKKWHKVALDHNNNRYETSLSSPIEKRGSRPYGSN